MQCKPLGNIYVVRLDKDKWLIKKPEAIVIPEEYVGRYLKKASSGIILKKGRQCNLNLSKGDKVTFSWIDNRPGFKDKEADYRFVKEEEILMRLKPIRDRVLVEVSESKKETKGGIVLPDTALEEKSEGVILSIGNDVREVKDGERVIFGKFSGDEIIINEKKCRILAEKELLAVIEK